MQGTHIIGQAGCLAYPSFDLTTDAQRVRLDCRALPLASVAALRKSFKEQTISARSCNKAVYCQIPASTTFSMRTFQQL
jgi:hypothetical protein